MVSSEKKFNNLFIYWLNINFCLVFLMIIVGGLTRLTDSGLSITEWELFSGILPPLTNTSWETYFKLYKKIPQYELLNSTMTLSEFKVIFYWEYFHRILGRIIGLFFLIPLIFFYFSKKINPKLLNSCYLIFILILAQGFVGWYMVQSGLVNDVTVSHYRLSVHLTIAIIILALIFWNCLNIKNDNYKNFFRMSKKNVPYFFFIILIFFQIILGAFVSGLNAGKIYQSWPLMGSSYFPNDLTINSFFNFFNFDNHSLIQFYHRNFAYLITICAIYLIFNIFKNKEKKLYTPGLILLLILISQVVLGIFTLLSDLHIAIASFHQITGVLLVLASLNLYYSAIK